MKLHPAVSFDRTQSLFLISLFSILFFTSSPQICQAAQVLTPTLCELNVKGRDLTQTDAYSVYNPRELTFFYKDKPVMVLVNHRGGEGQDTEGLTVQCFSALKHIYVVLDTSASWQGCTNYQLCDGNYVVHSSDGGKTWSELLSFKEITGSQTFALPKEKFFEYFKFLGDAYGLTLSVFNFSDQSTYLLDPELNILKTAGPFGRMNSDVLASSNPQGFYFHDGRLYTVGRDYKKTASAVMLGSFFLEVSRDYGKTWERMDMPVATQAYFFTSHDNVLYQVYRSECEAGLTNMVPAYDPRNKCGYIKIRNLNEKGTFEEPQILLSTAKQLLGVFSNGNPVLIWKDTRELKPKSCAFVPLSGCGEEPAFTGPIEYYEGVLDMENLKIKEKKIEETDLQKYREYKAPEILPAAEEELSISETDTNNAKQNPPLDETNPSSSSEEKISAPEEKTLIPEQTSPVSEEKPAIPKVTDEEKNETDANKE